MLQTVWFYLQTRLIKDDEGQGMVEYGLILALVAVVAAVALGNLGGGLGELFAGLLESLGLGS